MSIQVCVCGILIYQDQRGIKNSHLSYGGLPSALRSSKLFHHQSTRKQHSFLTFKGCLVDNIPGPGLKSIETILLVENDFPRKSIGFSGSPSRNLKSACGQAFDVFLINNSVHLLIKNYAHNLRSRSPQLLCFVTNNCNKIKK